MFLSIASQVMTPTAAERDRSGPFRPAAGVSTSDTRTLAALGGRAGRDGKTAAGRAITARAPSLAAAASLTVGLGALVVSTALTAIRVAPGASALERNRSVPAS